MSQERLPTLEEGRAARELAAPRRAEMYAAKAAANWTCQHEGCSWALAVLVVDTGDGLETRCRRHVGRLRVLPGQWNERSGI